MKLLGRILAGMSVLLLQACTSPPTPGPSITSTRFEGLQVAMGDCMVAPARAAGTAGSTKSLASAVIGAAISQGVNYFGKALTAAGAAKTWTVSGSRNMQASTDDFPQCVTIVRGSFLTKGVAPPWAVPQGWPPELQQKLAERDLLPDRTPDFIFEGEFIASADQSALTLRPIIATFSNPIGSRALRSTQARSSAVFLSITTPGTKPTLDTNPSAAIVLGKLTPATTRLYEPRPRATSPHEPQWFSLSKTDIRKPLTVHAMLSETQEESAFLTFTGAVFSDSKVTAAGTESLTQILVPGAKQQAEQNANEKAVSTANDADTKFVTALSKLTACSTAAAGPAAAAAGADARTALRNYIVAGALVSPPQNDVHETMVQSIDIRKSSKSIIAACGTVLAQLNKP